MKGGGFDRSAAPWDRAQAGDPEANKPTLVQTPEELLANERAPRTVPANRSHESPFDLEDQLAPLTGGQASPSVDPHDADDSWSPRPRRDEPSHIGQVIDDRYVVEALIARGGMGIVYRCRHKRIDRKFAVKIIRSSMVHVPDALRRFLMEAKAASSIGNEHIIDVVDYGGLADGSAYLVMELLEGVPLSDVIAKYETLPVARITAIAMQVCEGLRAAHEAGIVHRDLKPENIFLSNRKSGDFVKILDFGIAKMARSGEPLTRKGLIVGTPHYMSPEQAAGVAVDARGDIYSLGIIMYELATGRVPFDASHYMAVLAKHMTEPPPPFDTQSLTAKLPPDFEVIVLRCLAKRPEQRYQTMTEVLVDLERLGQRLGLASSSLMDVMMPLAPIPVLEGPARHSGHSTPAAASRSLIAQPKARSLGLLLSALVLSGLTGISLTRMQGPEPLHAAGAPSATAPAGQDESSDEARHDPARQLGTVKAPLAATTASHASAPGAALGPDGSALHAAGMSSPGATSAPVPAVAEAMAGGANPPSPLPSPDAPSATNPVMKMEPLTIVELAPGKSVEIEARTRLSLRLSREAGAAAEARMPRPRALEPGKSGGPGRGKAAGKGGAGKAELGTEAPPASELMNPWPAPVSGPAKK